MSHNDRDLVWSAKLAALLLAAHAVAYLTHEYAHSTLAWALGWMRSPFALDYGHATVGNLLLLSDVSDNVDYDPIMASGHGASAALIALAGPFVGNGLFYMIICALTRRWRSAGMGQAFAFSLALMCAGNVWSYVPIRALTTHADIAIAAQGLGIGVVQLFPFVLLPALAITWHFLACACPRWFRLLADLATAKLALLCAMAAYWFFVFFGGSARDGSYGTTSQALSLVSVYLCFPLAVVWLWRRCSRGDGPI